MDIWFLSCSAMEILNFKYLRISRKVRVVFSFKQVELKNKGVTIVGYVDYVITRRAR